MFRGKKLRQKNTIQMSSDEARALGRELIYLAKETEDHQWRHSVNILSKDNFRKTLIKIVVSLSETRPAEFEVEEETMEPMVDE